MDQNQNDNATVDDALQQAINEITNSSAEQQSNPFLDPVAGPAVPEPDAPEMTGPIESAGPFSIPEPETAPTPDLMPGGDFGAATDFGGYVETPIAEPAAEEPAIEEPVAAPEVAPINVVSSDLKSIQDEALRELVPMLDEISDIDVMEKDALYRRAYEYSHDPAILNKALANAKQITDPKERATALLYIVKAN